MFRNLEANRSLAASVAAALVLGLASGAAASGGVSSGPLLDDPACCAPAGNLAGRREPALLLAQAADHEDGETGTRTPPTTEPPRDGETGPTGAENGDGFRGSPKPAGPDLTVDEERDLISRGWD